MPYRIESDTLGEMKVPSNKFWGAQTARSLKNFPIGTEKMPKQIIHAFAIVKFATAKANYKLGLIEKDQFKAIEYAKERIVANELEEHFPLAVWQTGSGTQTNMNVNEVIAHVGNDWLKRNNKNTTLHPNDIVNKSQSSNDTYPTAMYLAFVLQLNNYVLPVVEKLEKTLGDKAKQFNHIVKIGRTHLQDATPITLGQEISGWQEMISRSKKMLQESIPYLKDLAIGGTAVGTGLNAHKDYAQLVCEAISKETDIKFNEAENKFHSLTSYDEVVFVHGALKALASDLMKIANDVRLLSSGPRSGIGEITIPANEPGSSIMPGKVNPTQPEALTMICAQVMGNDATIGFSASQGHFQLNVFKPVIAYNFLQSCQLLKDGIASFNERCIKGIEPNKEKIKQFLNQSLMLVTALSPHIGYEKAAEISQFAHKENLSLKEAAISLGYVTKEEYEEWIDPLKMTKPSD